MEQTGAYDTDQSVIEYINQLSPMQQKAYNIAKQHLGTSFNVVKSNGFIDWLKKNRRNKINN